jgi:hypothetical protein
VSVRFASRDAARGQPQPPRITDRAPIQGQSPGLLPTCDVGERIAARGVTDAKATKPPSARPHLRTDGLQIRSRTKVENGTTDGGAAVPFGGSRYAGGGQRTGHGRRVEPRREVPTRLRLV